MHISLNISTNNIRTLAMICEFQERVILKSVDSDDPVQPPVKLRNSK